VPVIDKTLHEAGLVLQGVLQADAVKLPESAEPYSQLLVFAHGGRRFWDYVKARPVTENPLDDTACELGADLMSRLGESDYRILYPIDAYSVSLLAIGRLLGWHHDSPMAIGIHGEFGTWFAYRLVIATNTDLQVSRSESEHPCHSCEARPCVNACPAMGVQLAASGGFDMNRCADERLRPGSGCAGRCLARLSCPVGLEHRYEDSQVKYHYDRSLSSLRRYRAGEG